MTTVDLPFVPPFDAVAAIGNLRAHAIPGAEIVTADSITRMVAAPSGPVAVTVTLTPDAISAQIGSDDPADVAGVTAVIRRWFDLDLDPQEVAAVLGPDPVIGPLLAGRPGLRVIGSPSGFETAIMTVLGQQVSLAAARTFGGRLVAALGEAPDRLTTFPSAELPASFTPEGSGPGRLALFPTAEAIAAADPEGLRQAVGLTGARSKTVQALAAACASGLPLTPDADPTEFRAGLLAIPGIGPWTADYLAVRVLGDRDAFTAGDLVLRRALGGVSAKAAEAASEAWRPYRAYALFHLWTSTAY